MRTLKPLPRLPRKLAVAAVLLGCLIALLGSLAAGAEAHQERGARRDHCRNTYYSPLYKRITKITARGAHCGTARKLTFTYMRAVSSSSGAVNFTGHCFGAHSYGYCTVHYRHRAWKCFHFDAVPARTRGLVRCTHGQQLIKFNIGT